MKRFSAGFVVLAMALVVAGLAFAKEEKKPDATLTLSEGQVAAGIGWSWGKGVLNFEGKEYKFKVKGLSVGDVGISQIDAKGDVFNLKKLSKFNGTYTSAAAGAAAGGGAAATIMKNQNGVTIKLVSTTQGVNFKLAVEGVKLTLEK
jgi:hypothetical protein